MTAAHPQQARLSFRSILGWIGSASAFGWPMITVLAFWPWLVGLFAETLPGYELAIDMHLFDLLNGVTPALILLAARFILRANQTAKFFGSTSRNLFVWCIAAGFGVVGPLWFSSLFGPVPSVYLAGIPVGIASVLGQILGYSTVTIVVRELRESAKQLAKKQHALRSMQANLEQLISSQREELRAQVEAQLSPQISEIQDQLDLLAGKASGISAQSVANKIRETIDQVIRPLSLEIDSESPSENRAQIRSISDLEKEIRRLPLSQRLKLKVPLGHVFNLTFVVFFLILFVVPSFAFLFGINGVTLVAAPASIIAIALAWMARRLTRDTEVSSLLAIVVVIISAFLASLPFALLGELSLPDNDLGLGLLLAAQAFIVCLMVFFGSLVAEASFIQLDRSKLANDRLRKLLAYLQSEAQINRRSLAQLVHGKVQAKLQASSIRLAQANEVTQELLADISDGLRAGVLDTANTSLDRDPIEQQLAEMTAQWEGICDLTFTFASGAAAVVDSNSVAKAAVVEVIREAINNAVKHGEADEADGVISLDQPDMIRLEIRNAVHSGSAAAQGTHPRGYGSQILDQITDGWTLKFTERDAILTATIKVSQ